MRCPNCAGAGFLTRLQNKRKPCKKCNGTGEMYSPASKQIEQTLRLMIEKENGRIRKCKTELRGAIWKRNALQEAIVTLNLPTT